MIKGAQGAQLYIFNRCSSTVSWQIKLFAHKCYFKTAIHFVSKLLIILLVNTKFSGPDFFIYIFWCVSIKTAPRCFRLLEVWWIFRPISQFFPECEHRVKKINLAYCDNDESYCQQVGVVIFHCHCQTACIACCSNHQQSEDGIGGNKSRNYYSLALQLRNLKTRTFYQGPPLHSLAKLR